jgi:hypothetical protein
VVAARIFGESAALLRQLHATADPADAIEYGRYRARARSRLGPAAFDSVIALWNKMPADSIMTELAREYGKQDR